MRVNQSIRANQVRLIDVDGAQLGIKPVTEALMAARSKGMDLVEIAPMASPPVCKILDYAKFLYEKDRQAREARKKQKSGLLKEVRLSPVIGIHDLDVKLRHIEEFLKAHDKVRVTVVFRGRQNQHKDLGEALLKRVQDKLSFISSVEQTPLVDRNRMHMMLTPKH